MNGAQLASEPLRRHLLEHTRSRDGTLAIRRHVASTQMVPAGAATTRAQICQQHVFAPFWCRYRFDATCYDHRLRLSGAGVIMLPSGVGADVANVAPVHLAARLVPARVAECQYTRHLDAICFNR